MRYAIRGFASLLSFCVLAAAPAYATAPANDNWDDAIDIGSLPYSTSDPGPAPDLTDATTEPSDPELPCLGVFDNVTQTVWYKYTTGASTEYLTLHAPIEQSDSSHALVLVAVYSGTPGAFTIVSGGCANYSDDIRAARLAGLRLAPETTYSIEVAVVNTGGTGNALALNIDAAVQYAVGKTTDSNRASCSNDCSLREAIAASNANPGAVIIPAGTYVLSGAANEYANASGDLDVTQGMGIYGAGMGKTIIDANHVDRALLLDPARVGRMAFAIGDLTLTNGATPAPGAGQPNYATDGGGLCVPNGNGSNDYVGLERIAVTSSTARGGGGIEFDAPGTIRDSWIAGNTATAFYGGGVDALNDGFHPLVISGSTISGNTVSGPAGGGGIYAHGRVSLVNSTVSANASRSSGGGIWFDGGGGGTLSIASSTIVWNQAFYDNPFKPFVAAGLYLDGDASVVNSIVAYNSGGDPAYEPDCLAQSGTLTASHDIVQAPANCPFAEGDTHIDPKVLPDLIDHGGPTPTHYLDADSPARDGGDAGGCKDPDGVLLAWDQRGPGFARVSGPQCDIGAVEWVDEVFGDGFE
jgi:CSLREA domain-containing protein